MTLFDTDVFTDLLDEAAVVCSRAVMIPRAEQAIAIVTAEEILRGQFNAIRQAEAGKGKIRVHSAYAYLQKSLNDIASFRVLPYSETAHLLF
jgi:tRNA(fMet)-specific endonuclease VapC